MAIVIPSQKARSLLYNRKRYYSEIQWCKMHYYLVGYCLIQTFAPNAMK